MKHFYIFLVFIMSMTSVWSQEYKRMISVGTYTVHEIQEEAKAYFSIVGKKRGNGYKPYKRWEYQALINMDENGRLKTSNFYFSELQKYNRYQNSKFKSSKTTVGTWQQLGPTSWNQTSGWNPGVGRVTSIAVDNGNANHIIIGSHTGGVWKTSDGGDTWAVLTDNLSSLFVYSLAIDPTNSSTYFWGSNGGAIFKSTDSGATWNLLYQRGTGNVNKILIDPINTNKMYCSIENVGVFKSVDGGSVWSRIHSDAKGGYDIEFKPGNSNVVYASGNQFFKSIDGGQTFTSQVSTGLSSWTQEYVSGTTNWEATDSSKNGGGIVPNEGASMAVFSIANFTHPETRLISPSMDLTGATAPELKFSHTQVNWEGDIDDLRVLYKTSAGGSWVELANYTTEVTAWSNITLSLPNPSSDYYIAFEGKADYARGITLDNVSVEDATLGTVFQDGFELGPNDFSKGSKMIGVSANDDSVMYVLEASGSAFGALFKSTDSGDTFVKLDHAGKNYFGYSSSATDDKGQAPRDMDIAISPTNIDEVHIAGVNTWRSVDGGVSFNITSQWIPNSSFGGKTLGYCHADVDILNYVNGKLYVGSDGGIFIAENPTEIVSGTYYTDKTSGLGIRQFYKIGVGQTDPVVISGGAQDNGTSVMINGNWTDWLGADGMESFVDKNDSNILYGTSQNGGLYKSLDGGLSLSSNITEPLDGMGELKEGNWITPFEQDPVTQHVIYSGYDEVHKSINGGLTWTSISQNFGENLSQVKIAPSNNNVLYASKDEFIGGNYVSLLYKTSNGGNTDWQLLSGYDGVITSIAIHPTDSNKIAIATTGTQKVYVSIDGGINWLSYLFDLPNFNARALAWQDNGKDGLYLGMYYGIYYIDNTTGSSWQQFGNNLPNVSISELEINTVTNKIYAATYGRGLWVSDLYEPSLNVEDFELNSVLLHPNPASKQAYLTWNRSEEVSIRVYSSLGKLMYYVKNQSLIKPLEINISKYSSGLYFVKINNANGILIKKLIID